MPFKPCAIIPSRNHFLAIGGIVERLHAAGLPVFIIDDASDEPARSALAAMNSPERNVVVRRIESRAGKGGAVLAGFALADSSGFTHAFQVDADGQHDLSLVPKFLTLGEAHPEAMVIGVPNYDRSAPFGRRIGRWITHFWVCIETLSTRVVDTMCGFRLYPLTPVMEIVRQERPWKGMEFDTEIFVRSVWRNLPFIAVSVNVTYPIGNISNFRLFHDNFRITAMHTRLVFTMLLRLPSIIQIRFSHNKQPRPWASLSERGSYWGLRFLAAAYRLTGRYGCAVAVLPIGAYFYLTGSEQRRASKLFLQRAFAKRGEAGRPNTTDGLYHALGFARKTVESFGAWLGDIDSREIDSPDQAEISSVLASRHGIILIVSHLGNIDITRAMLKREDLERITSLVHTKHAQNFERLLRQFQPDALLNTFQVSEVNPGTVLTLKEKIERGDWVAIAGDRIPIQGDERVSYVPFLGYLAPFPQGPYILAHLLGCPVYLMFCLRERGRYRISFERFSERIELPRHEKDAALTELAERYAQRLEAYCLRDPLQWYNFFDFWASPGKQMKPS